jgi:hypothetical protein
MLQQSQHAGESAGSAARAMRILADLRVRQELEATAGRGR